MKKICSLFILCFMALAFPILASTTPPKLILNDLNYKPMHTAKLKNDTLYISLDDFAQMTYGSYKLASKEQPLYTLTIQNHTFEFDLNSTLVICDHKNITLKAPTLLIDNIIYLPVNYFDLIDYPYTWDKEGKTFSLKTILPYSTTTDLPKDHTLVTTSAEKLKKTIGSLIGEDKVNDCFKDAYIHNKYICFASAKYEEELLKRMHVVYTELPQLEVCIRQVDLLSETPTVSQMKTLPVKVHYAAGKFSLTVGEENLDCNVPWIAFTPSTSHSLGFDAEKSMDMLIMRTLFNYYRDQNNLKDDKHFSPISFIQMDRSDTLSYQVYSDALNHKETSYQVSVYKCVTDHKVTYVIDLYAAK